MSVWVTITIHLLCTYVSEERGVGEGVDSKSLYLMSYTLRFVRLSDLDRLCQFGLLFGLISGARSV